MSFDPDEYLKEPFDPDAYLGEDVPAKKLIGIHEEDTAAKAGAGLRGVAEAGVGMLAGMPAMIGGGLYGLSTLASGQGYEQAAKNIEDFQHTNFGAGAYQAPSEEGRIATERLGEAFLLPGQLAGKAGALIGPRSEFAAQALVDMGMNFLPLHGAKKMVTPSSVEALAKPIEAPKTGVKSLAEALIKEDSPVDPNAALYRAEALRKQAEAQAAAKARGEQPITVDSEGNASTLGAPKNLEVQAPMERMATELGAEKQVPVTEPTPMSRMAEDLTNAPRDVIAGSAAETAARQGDALSLDKQREAQVALDNRKAAMEQEVAQRTTLDQGAAERGRQEAGTIPVDQEKHPFVKAAEARVTKAEQLLLKLTVAAEQGHPGTATRLARAKTDLAHLEAKAEKARQNVSKERQNPYGNDVVNMNSGVPIPWDMLKALVKSGTLKRLGTSLKGMKVYRAVGKGEDMNGPRKTGVWVTPDRDLAVNVYAKGDASRVVEDYMPQRDLYEAHPGGWVYAPEGTDLSGVQRTRTTTFGDMARSPSKGSQGGKVLVDWGTRKKLEGFSGIPGVKDTLRDIGNAMIKTPEEAIALAGKFTDVAQNKLQQGINSLTKGGTYLKGKVNNPVVHYVVDRFLTAEGLARGEINSKLNGEYLSDLRKLSKDEYQDAFTLLNAADLTHKTITPAMMQQHGLSANLQNFITTHQAMMGDVLGKINTAREAVGKKAITAREAYSAMSMSGDYRKVAYKTIDGVKTVVGVLGADRKAGKLGWTLEKAEKSMLEKDPTLEFGPMQDTTMVRGGNKGTPHEAFQDALKVLGENNPHVAEFLNTLKEVAKDDPANYMGMQTHTMQKKGVWGMEGRKPWMSEKENATAFFENQVRYMEGAFQWSHLAEAAKDSNAVLRDPSVAAKHSNAIALSEKYMQNALGLNPSRVGRAVGEMINSFGDATGIGPSNIRAGLGLAKEAANTMMLSLNPSFLAIQIIQGPAALPAMTALLRGRGLAPKATMLTGGLDHFTEAGIALLKGVRNEGSLSAIERGAVEYSRKNHIYATDMVEHTNQTTKGATYWRHKVTQSPAAVIESGTRAQVYMTFVKMMDASGLKAKDGLYEQAHRLTDQAMNNYGALEKPTIYNALGPLGTMAYNLKSFGHNEISRWSMYAREISATGNPVPLLTQMATTIALAGVMGLPFYSQWESLYDFITAKLGKPRSLSLDVIKASENVAKELDSDSDKFKFAMSHGGASIMGADISKRIGLGDVLASKASDAAFAGGGKVVDMAGSAIGAAMYPDEAHLKAAAMAWAPPVVSSILKEKWYTDENHSFSMNPDKPRQVTADLTERDKTLKKIGITGVNESVQKEKNFRLGELDKAYQHKRARAMNGMIFQLGAGKAPSTDNIAKYLEEGQGDPNTMVASLETALMNLKISPQKRAMLAQATSQSVTQALSLQRRMENQ